jgi:hypothetical protein
MRGSSLTARTLAAVGPKELSERGTPEFYREEAARLALLALDASEPGIRLQMLEMAATFKRLADRAEDGGNVIAFPKAQRESA